MSEELPSGKRIWEIAERAFSIDSMQWNWKDYFKECDRVIENLDPVESRMFKSMAFDYAEPGFRRKEKVYDGESGTMVEPLRLQDLWQDFTPEEIFEETVYCAMDRLDQFKETL